MIVQLHGIVENKNLDSVVLLVNGVGYQVYMNTNDLNNIEQSGEAKLFIYENIREQSHDLFGFLDNDTKHFFEKLVTVNGVGPKMAVSIMNIGSAQEIKKAISQGNIKYLQAASGVGKRVAERIIVDLKDKIGFEGLSDSDNIVISELSANNDEAFEALVSLGYSSYDATQALSKLDPALSVEEKIKTVLRSNSR
jgi:Holliday junction DNA helicase RuvA